jgi:predicted CXXCH cytochrome family protein
LNTETCLKCHPAKNQGKFVHTAVGFGCESCHVAASTEYQTTIMLRATGGNLCGKCHELRKEPLLHGPYKSGQCLICHNPHAEDHPSQTRAAVDTLCLACHMLNQPDARVNAAARVVTLLDGREYDLAAWESAPKISEGHAGNIGVAHGAAGGFTVNQPGKREVEINCLSCHDPHASKSDHLLRKVVDGQDSTRTVDGREIMRFNAELKAVPRHQARSSGGPL